MGTAIQIAVAAALVLAWIWVLGRPLVNGLLELLGGSGPMSERPVDGYLVHDDRASWFGWHRRPPVVRRRQLLLASLFAGFASFLLAVALRGRFVYLFGLMLLVMAVHLGVASHLGGKMLAARRESRRVESRGRVVAAGGMTIRASRVSTEIDGDHAIIRTDELEAHYRLPPVDGDGYESPLAGGRHAVTSLVEELIELEWGPLDAPEPEEAGPVRPVIDVVAVLEADDTATALAATDADLLDGMLLDDGALDDGALDDAVGEDGVAVPEATVEPVEPVESEPIFSRPPAQTPARPRRKARPIYIHSHLDEEGFEPPRAVNQQ